MPPYLLSILRFHATFATLSHHDSMRLLIDQPRSLNRSWPSGLPGGSSPGSAYTRHPLLLPAYQGGQLYLSGRSSPPLWHRIFSPEKSLPLPSFLPSVGRTSEWPRRPNSFPLIIPAVKILHYQ